MRDSNSNDELLEKLAIKYSEGSIVLGFLIIVDLITTVIFLVLIDPDTNVIFRISLMYLITVGYLIYLLYTKITD